MGRIRMDKCCCGLIKIETSARIFAVVSIVGALWFLGLAFFHKHLYRWEPYVFGTAGVFQLIAGILVLVACSKKRDDLMVLQMIVGALVIFAMLIFTCMMIYGQFDKKSKLQTSVRKAVTNMGIVERNDRDDSREVDEKSRAAEAREQERIANWTRILSALVLLITLIVLVWNIWALVTYYCAYIYFQEMNEDMPLDFVKCKTVIPDKISSRIFPSLGE